MRSSILTKVKLSRPVKMLYSTDCSSSSSSSSSLCRDRLYKTSDVVASSLPRHVTLSDRVPRVKVDYARINQIEEMRQLIKLAEERGDGVGRNEFAQDSPRAKSLFNHAEIFTVSASIPLVRSPHHSTISTPTAPPLQVPSLSGSPPCEILAFIAISPCSYRITHDPCLATVRIFRSPSLALHPTTPALHQTTPEMTHDIMTYRSLVRLAVQMTDDIDIGYTHAVMDVALCHVNLLRALKDEGFHVSAIIPDNVYVNGGPGVCENVILVKRFKSKDRPVSSRGSRGPGGWTDAVRPLSQVLDMLNRSDPCDDFMALYPSLPLPQAPFLPLSYTFKNGLRVTFRNMVKDDDDAQLFRIQSENARKGHGYAVHQFPSVNHFRKNILAEGYTVVMEDNITQKIVGFFTVGESMFNRGYQTPARVPVSLSPQFRGQRIAAELVMVVCGITKELGHVRIVHTTNVSNVQIKTTKKRVGFSSIFVGVIPNAGFVEGGVGCEDILVADNRLDNLKTFSEMVRENGKEISKL